ncbi:MAG: GNAT family N-acetyltransferase [Sulfitobacter sp.]
MRPSLEALGRFDPIRARERFLSTYTPEDTRLIYVGDKLAGFYVIRTHSGHIVLDHLYVSGDFQGTGLGRRAMQMVQEEARRLQRPIQLMALKQSAANAFYRACGFDHVSISEFDHHYIWHPTD